jgi:tetratricopeptide (TPR) repeat protein
MTLRVLAAAFAVVALAGCMERTVKTSQRVATAEEMAKLDEERKKARGDAATPEGQPTGPTSLEAEAERLRGEVEREPQNPKWHFLLGQVYEKQNRLEIAELRYRRGAELIPDGQYTGPHYVLGRVLAKEDKLAQALGELQKAVAVKPPDVEGYYLNPDYRESYFLLGAITYHMGDQGTAERNFRQFLKYGGETSRVVQFFPELVAE